MGLNPGDLEKVPKEMSVKECYERIYNWHKKYGKRKVKKRYERDNAYDKAYLGLVDVLPSANKASEEDMNFVFDNVISMLMEWSYHEEDEYGIKIAAYAHFAANKQYANGFYDREFRKSAEASRLFIEFGSPKWKEKYGDKDT